MEGAPKVSSRVEGTESESNLERREEVATTEILEAANELSQNVSEASQILESDTVPVSVKEKLLMSISEVSERIKGKYIEALSVNGVGMLALAVNDYLIAAGNSPIESGSVLDYANKVVLAGTVLFQTWKSVGFISLKRTEQKVVDGVEAGTIEGMADGLDFVTNDGKEFDPNETYPRLSKDEVQIYDDHMWAISPMVTPNGRESFAEARKIVEARLGMKSRYA